MQISRCMFAWEIKEPAVFLLTDCTALTRGDLFTPNNLHHHQDDPFHAKKREEAVINDITIQYYRPTPTASWSQGLHPRTCVWVWMKRIASGGGENSRWQDCPHHVCFLGENNASLRVLIKGGEGDFSPRTAGRQRASHPPLSLRVHTQTHTLCN